MSSTLPASQKSASKLPSQNTTGFAEGLVACKRINLKTIYGSKRDVTQDLTDGIFDLPMTEGADIISLEQHHNAHCLRALTEMLHKHHYPVTAEALFQPGILGKMYSNQPIIFLDDFQGKFGRGEPGNPKLMRHNDENTTGYHFDFTLTLKMNEHETVAMIPLIAFDAEAINLLRGYVAEASVEKYFLNFMKMAQLSEHDGTVHQLVLPQHNPKLFLDPKWAVFTIPDDAPAEVRLRMETLSQQRHDALAPFLKGKKIPETTGLSYVENHALALHAQILRHLFAEPVKGPARKNYVLRTAVETFAHLADMQQQAHAQTKGEPEQQEIDRVITYLTETYYHRFARVISPDDTALKKKKFTLSIGGKVQELSVADAASLITLITPEDIQLHAPKGKGGLATLEYHSDQSVGKGTYRHIHHMKLFPVTTEVERALTEDEKNVWRKKNLPEDQIAQKKIAQITNIEILNAVDALAAVRGFDSQKRKSTRIFTPPDSDTKWGLGI